jgi:hypothetical protein
MSPRVRYGALVAALIWPAGAPTMAQGPVLKRVNYSINVSYRMGDYIVPAGGYVLYQLTQNDQNLFALYQTDLTGEPIAMVTTRRVDCAHAAYPTKTRILVDLNETATAARPVLHGWTIPGEAPWQVMSVLARDERVLARVK